MLERSIIDNTRRRHPDKRGEEGRVYFFGTPQHPLALKEWYQTHVHKQVERRNGLRIPISPFHHKMMYHELSLIHSLFPEHTVGVIGGVDPRLQSIEQGTQFSATADLPITVMERAPGDPAGQADYDTIMDQAYTVLLGKNEVTQSAYTPRQKIDATQKADEAVTTRFGPELRHVVYEAEVKLRYESNISGADVRRTAQAIARQINPDSVLVQMLDYGIAPIHPAFNFVPGEAKPDKLKPHGTFVELQIIDQDQLAKQITGHADETQLRNKLKRFRLFQNVDIAYTHLFTNCSQAVIDNSTIQQAAYEALITTHRCLEAGVPEQLRRPVYMDYAEAGQLYGKDPVALLRILGNFKRYNLEGITRQKKAT